MTERKRKLEDINKEISACKSSINLTEGHIINNLSKYSTPQKGSNLSAGPQTASTNNNTSPPPKFPNSPQPPAPPTAKKPQSDQKIDQQVVSYIKNMNRLKDSLQQKTYIIEVQHQKDRLTLQNEINKLKAEITELSNTLDRKETEIKQKNDTINVLKNQVAQLERTVKEKQAIIGQLKQEIAEYRKQNVEIKLQNKNVKVDNKVIMNQIDRLTKEIKNMQEKKDPLAEREYRVMKSLYQESLASIELKESVRRHEVTGELTNKILLEDSTQRNGQLKTLIRRQNEQIELLNQQKQLLMQQNKQKTINLQNQKTLTKMVEEEKDKVNGILMKMGEKILSLENINETLKESIRKMENQDEDLDQNYYRQTKAKAGQFYYRRS